MSNAKLPIRIEELLPVARWLRAVFIQHRKLFEDYSPNFGGTFLTVLDEKIETVEKLISTKLFLGEIMKITQALYLNMTDLRPMLLKLEGYVKLAINDLGVDASLFDFKKVRKCIDGRDAEGLELALGELLQHADANTAALTAKGFKPEMRTQFGEMLQKNRDLADDQNIKMRAKEDAVKANNTEIMNLWNDCALLMDSGKRVFKYDQPDQVKNVTLAHILKTMRHEGGEKGEGEATPPKE